MKIRRYFWLREWELIVVAEDFKNYAVSIKDQTFVVKRSHTPAAD